MNYAIVCLDETGSMSGQQKRVVTSLNEYVNQLPDDVHITVFKFDSNRWTTFFDDEKAEWVEMKVADYAPGAMTPLYDAIGKTLIHAGSLASDGDKVMIMVDTDGYENASKEHSLEAIKAKVEEKKSGGWEFLFMASGLDERAAQAVGATGASLGMGVRSAAHSRRVAAYSRAGEQTRSYFEGEPADDKEKEEGTEPFFAGGR